MKCWNVKFTLEADRDRSSLDTSVRNQVDKAIRKVSQNPLPKSECGYGTPLGHKSGSNLTGLCKITLKKLGVRVVYRLIRDAEIMLIIVIATRADDEVYEIADMRK